MDKFFKISERGSTVKTEIIAGLTTFFAMAYIIVVNPNQIVGFSFDVPGVPAIWNAVYIGSILAAVIGTMLYALYAKLPFAQACGMGLNSFFFTSFVLPQIIAGGDVVKGYQAGLVIILISGIVFLLLSITGAREYIAKAMPDCIKKAIPAGIGLFIAFIGFQNVGIIQANQYTLVQFVRSTAPLGLTSLLRSSLCSASSSSPFLTSSTLRAPSLSVSLPPLLSTISQPGPFPASTSALLSNPSRISLRSVSPVSSRLSLGSTPSPAR